MKLTTRKERINFDVASDLTARHRICAAFLGYKERVKSKLITDVKSSTMKTRSQTNKAQQQSLMWRWAQDAEDFIPPAPTDLVRTEAFIECRHCRFKNTKYEDNCVKCDTELSTRPSVHKYL
jgi:hypothetical protein